MDTDGRAERIAAATRANHCRQAQAGYYYCKNTPGDPCGPGPRPHDGHQPGQCDQPRQETQ